MPFHDRGQSGGRTKPLTYPGTQPLTFDDWSTGYTDRSTRTPRRLFQGGGSNPLLGLTDLFSKLEVPEEHRGMIEDPLGHFGLGEQYAQFFPSFDFYQRQFSNLFGTGEGSMYETEMERTGQVGRTYELGRGRAMRTGTESLLDLTEQLRGKGVKAGGFGAQKALGRDIREEATGTYAEKLSGLEEEKELGMYGVEQQMEGMYGDAQSLMGDFINQYLSIYRNIMTSMPTDTSLGRGGGIITSPGGPGGGGDKPEELHMGLT